MIMTEEKWKEKYAEFKMLQEHIEQITEQVQLLAKQEMELDHSKDALLELANVSLGEEILVPIANGIFFRGVLKENKTLIVNVGANVTVERTIPEVAVLLEQEKLKIQEQIAQAEKILQELHARALKIYEEVS